MPEDPILAAALLAAQSKKSRKVDLDKMRPKTADMVRNLPRPLPDGAYCKVCQYPKQADGSCWECEQRGKADRATLEDWKVQIGGPRAWTKYTKERYVETAFNSAAMKAALKFDWKRGNFLLTGPAGTGKSHLAAMMKRPWIMAGTRVSTVFMQDELSAARADIKKNDQAKGRVAALVAAKVLSIEDLGVEKPSSWVVNEWYYPIINGRYLADKPGMIITMNQSLEELEYQWSLFDPHKRVVSRIREMFKGNIYSLQGEKDWRAEG